MVFCSKYWYWVVILVAMTLGLPSVTNASVVWDYSPFTTQATLAGLWSNEAPVQNFGELVSFGSDQQIVGMDIYTELDFATVGQSVTVRIWSDAAGVPGSLLFDFTEAISVVDSEGAIGSEVRVHADFTTPVTLLGGTGYWIGMSGTSTQLGQRGLIGANAPDNSRMAQFSGTTYSGQTETFVGDMAFRLHGPSHSAVPEPSAIAIWSLAAMGCLIGFRVNRKRMVK